MDIYHKSNTRFTIIRYIYKLKYESDGNTTKKKYVLKKIEYLIRPVRVYLNDTYNFIILEEDEETR